MRANGSGDAYFISPELEGFDASKRISFWLSSGELNNLEIGTIVDPTDLSTFETYQSLNVSDGNGGTWRNFKIDFANYVGSASHIAFRINGSGVGTLDDFSYENSPSCTEAYQLSAEVFASEALLDWEDYGAPTNWDIEYGPAGFEQGTGTIVTATSKPFLISQLASSTSYDFYVQSNCDGAEGSGWSFNGTFRTLCEARPVDYNYSFDDASLADFNQCWEKFGIVNNYNGGNNPASQKNIELRAFNNQGSTIVTPELIEISNNKRVKLWVNSFDGLSGLTIGTMQHQNDDATFTEYQTIDASQFPIDVWVPVIVNLDTYSGNDRFIAIRQDFTGSNSRISIDDFSYQNIPSCTEPINFEANTIADTQVNFNWTDLTSSSNWEIEYGETGFTLGTGTVVTSNTTSTTVGNLIADTTYDFFLRSVCSSNDSSEWVPIYELTTACGPITVDYTQNFDAVQMANCWTTIPAMPTGATNAEEVTTSTNYKVFDSGYSVRFTDYSIEDNLYLISPELSDLGAPNNRVKFWLHSRYLDANLIVGTMSNPEDETTFTAHTTILNSDMLYREWKQFTVNLDDYTGVDRYVAFKMELVGDASNIYEVLYLDQFEYSITPTCETPTELSNDLVANGNINLSWQDTTSATQWEIEYGESGFWQGQGTVLQSSTNPFELSGLLLETSYDIYIRSICNTNQFSDWSTKLTVDMGCGESYTTGYNYDFNSTSIDLCWTAFEYPSNTSSTSFSMSNTIYNGDSGYAANLTDTSFYNSNVTLMVSPIFTDLTSDKKVEFYISDYSGGLQVGTMSDPNDGGSFELLETISGNVPASNWEKRIVYLSNYNGVDKYIAFRQKRSSSTGSQVYIDDFSYLQSVNCTAPTNFEVVAVADNAVDLSWAGSGIETEWELEYEQVGQTNSETTLMASSQLFTIDNLLEGTEYTVKLRAKCDDDALFSEWTASLTFTTSCTPASAYYFESFEFGNVLSPCWSTVLSNDLTNIIPVQNFTVNSSINYVLMPVSGNRFIKFSNNYENYQSEADDFYLVSRQINDIDANKRVRFHLISYNTSPYAQTYNMSTIQIGTMSNPNDASTFTLVQTITPDEMNELKIDGLPITDWKEHTVYFNNYEGSDQYIAIRHGDESFGSEFFLDDFKFEIIPACTEPLYPEIIDERFYEVDVSWSSYENSNASEWEVQYGVSNFALGSGITVESDAQNLTLVNLMPDTEYDFYVRSLCAGDFSEWSVKKSFHTKCEGFEVGYFENFDNQSAGHVESCWTGLRPVNGDPYWDESINSLSVTSILSSHTSPNAVRLFNEVNHPYGDAVSDQIVLVSPRLIGFDNYKKIKFWINPLSSPYATPTEIIIGTLSDPDDYSTFTPFYTITDAFNNEDSWTQYEVDFSDYNLTDAYVGFKQAAINERQVVLIDDFEYTENGCVTPTALQASQNGTNSALLFWQDNNTQSAPNNWEIEYGPVGFEQGTGTVITANTNPVEISGLSSLAVYEYVVRAHCNEQEGYSNWSTPYTFAITCEETAPFSESFDQYNAFYQNYNSGIPGFCWTRNDRNVSGIADTENDVVSPSSAPNVGFVNFYGSELSPLPGMMVSPYLSDFDSNKILKIWVRNETDGSAYNTSGLIIGTMSNPQDSDTFEPFSNIEAEQIPHFGKEFFIDFSTYTGNAHHIAIKHDQTNDHSLVMFDDLYYKEKPTCLEPINIDFFTVSDTNVILTWENYGTGSSFEVEYGPVGFSIGSGSIATTNENTITIEGLNVESTYEFYVRTICGANNSSEWIGPKEATTSCNVATLPWVENFDEMTTYGQGILPECFQNDDVWVSSNTNLSAYQQGDGDTEYLYAIFDQYGIEAYMITPMFALEAGTTYNLVFKIRKEQGDYSSQSVKVWTGQGNTPEALDNFVNYFADFDFGFYDYHPIVTTFTPVVSGDYAFLLDFGYSSIVHTIAVDSFSLDGDYEITVELTEDAPIQFDFNDTLPLGLILEQTENTSCAQFNDNGENVILFSGGSDASAWFNAGDDAMNWIENQNFISKVNLEVDATSLSQLFMNFDLKQTFANQSSESLFRVVANGDVIQTFMGNGNASYESFEIDLSAYAGNTVRISLQHLGRDRNNGSMGDRAFLDNLAFGAESTLKLHNFMFTGFSFHPNPVTQHLFLKNSMAISHVKVLDLMGRTLKTKSINNQEASIDLSDLPSAVYFVEVHVGDMTKTIKVLKN